MKLIGFDTPRLSAARTEHVLQPWRTVGGLAGVTRSMAAQVELLAADPHDRGCQLEDQVAKQLFERWGLTPIKQTETGSDSTNKETLHELAHDHPLAKTLRTYREALNNRTKFSTAIRSSLDYNKGVEEGPTTYPQARVFGTYTGRMT